MLVKITLDLDFALTYARRLVPMQFGKAHSPIRQPNLSNSLAFPPARPSITSSEPRSLPNSGTDGDRLDIGDSAKDSEVHLLTVLELNA
jgi:hypothetical protein